MSVLPTKKTSTINFGNSPLGKVSLCHRIWDEVVLWGDGNQQSSSIHYTSNLQSWLWLEQDNRSLVQAAVTRTGTGCETGLAFRVSLEEDLAPGSFHLPACWCNGWYGSLYYFRLFLAHTRAPCNTITSFIYIHVRRSSVWLFICAWEWVTFSQHSFSLP